MAVADPWDWSQFFSRAQDSSSKHLLFAGLASTGLAQSMDSNMREQWVDHQRMSKDTARVGDLMGMGLVGVPVALGQYFYDHENGMNHLRGLISVTSSTYLLKLLAGRRRPGTSQSTQSFPSGHTSTAFMTATSLSMAYGRSIAVVAYPLATLVGLSRMADDAHWLSDVVAGAFLGIWAGRASFYGAAPALAWTILPWQSNEAQGLVFQSQY